ncbi:MAG TPA: protein kinase [Terriglobales bacterium]|nr:protein kinase [Terriglobales bacterium]
MEPLNRRLGFFEIVRKLGRGGMADVYLARDTARGEAVALKLIEHGTDIDTQESIAAERRGSLLQKYLAEKDPHVVRIHNWGDLDGYFYISMEYIAGEDLAEVMQRGPIPPEQAASIAADICLTLENAHTLDVSIDGKEFHGIVHGDVKPRNIRIDSERRVRVIDFGIAKALSLSRRLTRNEFGSVPYASPERLDTGDVDAHSDLWSIGVLLYEMVSGRQPYQAENTHRLEHLIRSHAPFTPLPESCPLPLREIIAKALAPDAKRRYSSAHELRQDLISFQNGGPVKAMLEADADATRRTVRPAEASDETRRTVKPKARGTAAPPARETRVAPHRPRLNIGMGRLFLGVVLLFAVYMLYEVTTGYLKWSRGRDLVQRINAESVADPDQIWREWQKVAKGTPGSILLYDARRKVRNELEAAAERVIMAYRNNDAQPVYERDWDRARRALAHALELDPDNDKIRGELRLCEGHLARIRGVSRRNTAQLTEAVEKFRQAAQLLRKSPDPDLGLARTYIYGLKDVEKADVALRNAEKHGYELGSREKSQLADGYRDRADRLWSDSRSLTGLPQEKDMLEKSAEDYERALELYQGIAPYANASANVVRVQEKLDRVKQRIDKLDGGFPWF